MDPSALLLRAWLAGLALSVGVALLLKVRRDPATWLLVYIVVLFGISATLVIGPAGAIGTPAIFVGATAAWLYWSGRIGRVPQLDSGWQPVRAAVLVYAWYMVLTVVLAYTRPLTALEVSGSTRELVRLTVHVGIALMAVDGLRTRERLDTVLRALVYGGAFLALLGLVQFVIGVNPADYLRLPGLSNNAAVVGQITRSIFNRPSATAMHPIEYSVVLAVLLPIAVHYALHSASGWQQRVAIGCTLLIAAGVPMSVSRSGVVGLAVGLPVLSMAWTWRRRIFMLAASTVFLAAMYTVIPGLLGTIRGLFANAETDPSVQARADRIPRVIELFGQRPLFGRGFGTYSVEDYFLLDNEYFVSAIEVGAVGIVVILGMILTGIGVARAVRHWGTTPDARHLGQAIAAALAVVVFTTATFDAFFYHIFSGVMFLLLGCAGALWRIEMERQMPRRIGYLSRTPMLRARGTTVAPTSVTQR